MRYIPFVLLLLVAAPLSGCLATLNPISDGDCVILDAGRESDGVLRILTYDIAAFSDEMLATFTEQTGYEV